MHLLAAADGGDELATGARDYLRRSGRAVTSQLVATISALMDDYGSITFTRRVRRGHLVVAEDYFEQAFADAHVRGPDLDCARWCPM